MKLTSKYFDSIRVKPEDDRRLQGRHPTCFWRNCARPGMHPAPRGRDNEGEYYYFCQQHIREYNKTYNYFEGMNRDDIIDFQKDAMTGHRPTWAMGEKNGSAGNTTGQGNATQSDGFQDPFGLFEEEGSFESGEKRPRRIIRNLERKSLNDLGLSIDATARDIKSRYKELVKRLHPDLNGGNRDSEDKLREVLKAYKYLKKVGLC